MNISIHFSRGKGEGNREGSAQEMSNSIHFGRGRGKGSGRVVVRK